MWICTCEYRCPWRPERFPGAGVTAGGELPGMGAGLNSARATSAPNTEPCLQTGFGLILKVTRLLIPSIKSSFVFLNEIPKTQAYNLFPAFLNQRISPQIFAAIFRVCSL